MAHAQFGDTVKVHYSGWLDDGTLFDTSVDDEPLRFAIGEGAVLEGFERAVIGMSPGESKRIRLAAEDAYGPHRPDLVVTIPHEEFPAHIHPRPGQQLQVARAGLRPMVVTVVEVSEAGVTLDANHPLAGKELTFEIRLIEIEQS